jgi:dipeptidyl aminopeptidase/acylaminoacyl peptidase
MIPTLAAAAALAGLSRAGVHAAIRRGLRAAREDHVGTPGRLGLHACDVRIPTSNGKHLFGWFIAAAHVAPAVVVMHGWGANASLMLAVAQPLHEAGFAVLLLDARGHGRSDDDGFASLPRFAEDIEHGLDWLRRHPGIDAARCAVLGHSVGAGAALLAASRRTDVAAVVSVSAFAHPGELLRRMLAQRRIPYTPVGWYVLRYVQHVIGHRFDDIAPVNTITRVRCPVLLVHGTEDRTVPFDDARRIVVARAHRRVRLVALPGGHDIREAMTDRIGALIRFLDLALAGRITADT